VQVYYPAGDSGGAQQLFLPAVPARGARMHALAVAEEEKRSSIKASEYKAPKTCKTRGS
jgi:hypothetical protein